MKILSAAIEEAIEESYNEGPIEINESSRTPTF